MRSFSWQNARAKMFFNISKIIHSDEEKLRLTRGATTRTMRQRFNTVKQDLDEPSLPVFRQAQTSPPERLSECPVKTTLRSQQRCVLIGRIKGE